MLFRFCVTIVLLGLLVPARWAAGQYWPDELRVAGAPYAGAGYPPSNVAWEERYWAEGYVEEEIGACGELCQPPTWLSATAEYFWLGRSPADSRRLLTSDFAGTLLPEMDVRDLTFEVAGGVRGQLAIGPAEGWGVKLGYFGVFDQSARRAVNLSSLMVPPDSVTYSFFGATGGSALAYSVDYESDLHSAEINLRGDPCWNVAPLVGVRWIQHAEEFEVFESPAPLNGALAEIRNDLVGGQFGFKTRLWDRGGWFRVELASMGGVFHNEMDLYADTHTAAGPTAVLIRKFRTTAYASELRLTAVWQIHRGFLFRAGYTGLWLAEVAMVADQSDNFSLATGQGSLDVTGISYHGGHVGMELRW